MTKTTTKEATVLGMRRPELFSVGVWVLVLVATAFMMRSLAAVAQAFTLGVVVVGPVFLTRTLYGASWPARVASRGLLFAYALVVLVFSLGAIERGVLEYADTYPRFLLSGDMPAELIDERLILGAELRTKLGSCAQEGLVELFHKVDGLVVRCGYAWYYPSTKTFFVPGWPGSGAAA